ncbi:MAG: cytochrome c oxidase subunit II [Alphaproteobacteria bacterium]|nr:cytochrome c oxidase subunit II [Alphaproteobacteria bacterium SS10]
MFQPAGLVAVLFLAIGLAFGAPVVESALAQSASDQVVGAPEPWQLNFQDAASPVKEQVHQFHNMLLVIITAISVFVLALLAYVIIRYNEKMNPEPSKTSHNTLIEVIWTAVPVMILIVIVVPSFSLLYYMDRTPDADLTIKTTGYQWYWTYEYPDYKDLEFTSIMLQEDELQPGQPRLLATDNDVVVPVGANVRLLITAADVLHAWAMPALGVKKDAVPGRLNETWFRADKPGMYYGQCSEICGEGHGFMPISLRAVPMAEFEAWVEEMGGEAITAAIEPRRLAEAAVSAE